MSARFLRAAEPDELATTAAPSKKMDADDDVGWPSQWRL
jgi:hypothetical protein